ncbi:Hsp20/alpha crystallin family protein [Marinithermofilum abyssi]|nr:Hsp20/alpha crystallin family protein [Marinithermofilum abyssi]
MGLRGSWFERMLQEEMTDFIKEMNRLVQMFLAGDIRSDLYQTATEVVVTMEIPRLSPEHELNAWVESQRILYVSGVIQESDEGEGMMRVSKTTFTTNLLLPVLVDGSRLQTSLNQAKNLLTIRLPKVKEGS